jgi:hypothetical protein
MWPAFNSFALNPFASFISDVVIALSHGRPPPPKPLNQFSQPSDDTALTLREKVIALTWTLGWSTVPGVTWWSTFGQLYQSWWIWSHHYHYHYYRHHHHLQQIN